MIINDESKIKFKTLEFDDICIGNYFEFDKKIYLKISEKEAFDLKDGYYCVSFDLDDIVYPINILLINYKKELS